MRGEKQKTKTYKEECLKRKNPAKKRRRKKFQQSELHCRAYKLNTPEGHLGSHLHAAVLTSWSWWNSHSPDFLRKTDIFPFQDWCILYAVTSSWPPVASKLPWKKNPPEEIHGLKVIKKHMTAILLGSFAIKQAAHTVLWKPRNIGVIISQLICINDDCGPRCAYPWRNIISPLRLDQRWTKVLIKDNHGGVNTTDAFIMGCFNLFDVFEKVNDALSVKPNIGTLTLWLPTTSICTPWVVLAVKPLVTSLI